MKIRPYRRMLPLLPLGLVLGGCGGMTFVDNAAPSPTPVAAAAHVRIVGNPLGNPDSLYRPARVLIHVGQTVSWTVIDDQSHTVTPNVAYAGWAGGSDVLKHGADYSHRFTHAGTFRYYCTVHPNMLGIVVVKPR
jgi:plastocyanin